MAISNLLALFISTELVLKFFIPSTSAISALYTSTIPMLEFSALSIYAIFVSILFALSAFDIPIVMLGLFFLSFSNSTY